MIPDRRIFLVCAFLRATATGLIAVVLGLYIARLGFDPTLLGIVIASGLAGNALAAVLATFSSEKIGLRRFLITLAVVGASGALIVSLASDPLLIAVAAFIGMLNGHGRDRGAALILEQAALPATTDHQRRTKVFAWYNVLQDIGHAVGGLLAGIPAVLAAWFSVSEIVSLRWLIAISALMVLVTALLYARLSPKVSAPRPVRVRLAPQSRRIIYRISALFALDSFGGGFLTTSLITYFFYERFGVAEGEIGGLFFLARSLNAVSHFGAAWLAGHIGLVNTMVFTHIPSSLLLCTVAFAPTFPIAAILFLLREGLVEMDVPTRQSYVMAVVRPEERTAASGITNLVRISSVAVASSIAGLIMKGIALNVPLFVGAGMKITYDLLLWRSFRHIKPPEEISQE